MSAKAKSIFFSISLAINVFIAVPALVLVTFSTGVQYQIYQKILAPRLGDPEIVFIGDSLTLGGGAGP